MKRFFEFNLILAPIVVTASSCSQPAYFDGFETLRIDNDLIAEQASLEFPHPLFPYWVQTEYFLDYGAPTDAELEALQLAGADPDAVKPWIDSDDLEISVQWKVVNTGDSTLRAFVLLDGATEFFDWDPVPMFGMAGGADAEELPFPSLAGNTPLEIKPGESLSGEFREDDLREAMVDLDVMTRYCGSPFSLLYNRGEVEPLGMEYVKEDAVFAGPYMLRLTLGGNGPATLDYALRVRDRDEVLFDGKEDDDRFDPEPDPWMPSGFSQDPAADPAAGMLSEYCESVLPDPEEEG
jgi:hypothetical protein